MNTNTILPSGPELQVSRSTPGGSTGCQHSSCIPSLAPSLLPPSSLGCLCPHRFLLVLPLPGTCAETAGKQREPVKATVKLNQESQIKYLTSE